MISEVCRAYGWTADYALYMPAARFFAMLREARLIRLRDLSDMCDIAFGPACKYEYTESLKRTYAAMSMRLRGVELQQVIPETIESPIPEPTPQSEMRFNEKDKVFAMFIQARRQFGK